MFPVRVAEWVDGTTLPVADPVREEGAGGHRGEWTLRDAANEDRPNDARLELGELPRARHGRVNYVRLAGRTIVPKFFS